MRDELKSVLRVNFRCGGSSLFAMKAPFKGQVNVIDKAVRIGTTLNMALGTDTAIHVLLTQQSDESITFSKAQAVI